MTLILKIEIEGHTDGDVELALEQVSKQVKMGRRSGADSNDTGSFSFSVEGEEEEGEPWDWDETDEPDDNEEDGDEDVESQEN